MDKTTVEIEFSNAKKEYELVSKRFSKMDFGDAGFHETQKEFLEKQKKFLGLEVKISTDKQKNFMSNKLQQKIRQVEDEHAEETFDQHIQIHASQERDNALMLLGGFKVVNRIALSLSSELMRALITFQEGKLYESLGYENFVEFLNNSDYAPMTKSQFYERKSLLEKEGDVVFDFFNAFSLPVSKRKFLGKGNISLDGETVIVKSDDGEETTIEISDRARLLETLTALADANADKSKKLDRQKQQIQKSDETIADLRDTIVKRAMQSDNTALDPHAAALLSLVAAFQSLKGIAEGLEEFEKSEFAPRVFETIAAQLESLSTGYGRNRFRPDVKTSKKSIMELTDDEREKYIESKINDDELADLMD